MPQFDFSSFFSQVFWVLFFVLVFYFYISLYYLPITGYYLKTRKNFVKKRRKVYVTELNIHPIESTKSINNKKIYF
jgi:hypothetical protein